jgi:hypothetical protein
MMKQTLAEPRTLPRLGISRLFKGLFARQEVRTENKVMDSIFSLACQRCAGFTTRPPERKEQD